MYKEQELLEIKMEIELMEENPEKYALTLLKKFSDSELDKDEFCKFLGHTIVNKICTLDPTGTLMRRYLTAINRVEEVLSKSYS